MHWISPSCHDPGRLVSTIAITSSVLIGATRSYHFVRCEIFNMYTRMVFTQFNADFTALTYRSQTPSIWGAFGGLKRHLILANSHSLASLNFNCKRFFANHALLYGNLYRCYNRFHLAYPDAPRNSEETKGISHWTTPLNELHVWSDT